MTGYWLNRPVSPAASLRLGQVGVFGLCLLCLTLWWRSPLEDWSLRIIGVTIVVLGCLPAIRWAYRVRL